MSQIQQASENKFVTLMKPLLQIPEDMKSFSQSMRSLYNGEAVGTSTDAGRKFQNLRDETRQYALVYLESILPETTKFVGALKNYFAIYHDALSFGEWCEMLPDVLEEMTSHKEVVQTVVTKHKEMITPLKNLEDKAKMIMTEFKDLQATSENEREALQPVTTGTSWLDISCIKPFKIFLSLCTTGNEKEDTKHTESEIHEAQPAPLVSNTLIWALSRFIDGVIEAASFFKVIESELRSMVETTDTSVNSPKRLYFMRVKNEAKDLKPLCQAFCAVLPDVRTDFQAIPAEDTDQNIVSLTKSLEERETTLCNE